MTDMYTPFLITNYVSNRSTLVYKKIKIALKQRDLPIPHGPTAYELEDIPEDLNDTIGEFIRETSDAQHHRGRETYSQQDLHHNRLTAEADNRLKINEKYV